MADVSVTRWPYDTPQRGTARFRFYKWVDVIDFRGARGSNAGDDFHELWTARQAIRLLSNEDGLEAITVEGLSVSDEQGVPPDAWDGVDCALYFGGRNDAKPVASNSYRSNIRLRVQTSLGPLRVSWQDGGTRR